MIQRAISPEMEMVDYVDQYSLERPLAKLYVSALRLAARRLTDYNGGSLPLKALSAPLVNGWLCQMEREGRKPTNILNQRRGIHALWRGAWEAELAPTMGVLRRIKVPGRIPQAVTLEQVGALLHQVEKLTGFFQKTSVPRRTYWKSLILAYWDTALRIGDLRRLQREWIQPDGIIGIVQNKTGRTHHVKLRPETIEQIDLLIGGRKTGPVWDKLNKKNFFTSLRKIFARAGVPGSGRWLRRGSASYVEAECPGTGWKHLGHTKPGLAEAAYIDPRIAVRKPVNPPAVPAPNRNGGAE